MELQLPSFEKLQLPSFESSYPYIRPETDKIAGALSKAQGMYKPLVKDKTAKIVHKSGGSHEYKYADLGSVLDCLRIPFEKNGLSVDQEIVFNDKHGVHFLITEIKHESGQWIRSVIRIGNPESNTAQSIQAFGSVITYFRRYSLVTLAAVSSEDDDDGARAGDLELPSPKKSNAARLVTQGEFAKHAPTPSEADALIQRLKTLCDENKVDFNKFGMFHRPKLNSKDASSIKSAVDNFDKYLDDYYLSLDSQNNKAIA